MIVEYNTRPGVCEVEIESHDQYKVVEENEDGSYKVLGFTGDKYVLFSCATITRLMAHADKNGEIYRLTTKEIWDSWGKTLPAIDGESEVEE